MKPSKYKYNIGDYISSRTIQVGKVVGHVERGISGAVQEFYVVEERIDNCYSKTIKHYVPQVFEKNMRSLPETDYVKKVLSETKKNFSFSFNKTEKQPSRYKFLSEELKNASFKKFSDIVHFLCALEINKKITASEKKLLKSKKEQFMKEVGFITDMDEKEIELLIHENATAIAPEIKYE